MASVSSVACSIRKLREGESPFDHNIWVICGEGDIEEGISGEAASLAANQQLGNLTVIFDANRIQIEGDTNLVLAEDVLKRFQAYGWYTDEFSFIQPDGSYKEDVEGLADTIAKARAAAPNQPKLIKVDTLIAWPTPGKTNDRPPTLQAGRRGRRRPQEAPRLRPGGVLPR